LIISYPTTGKRMPRQNRVNPYGEIFATDARGTLMGNRGCLHNEQGEIKRQFQVKRWIICVLEFKNRHREMMEPGLYTHLFFLDEATALAAGHRPCAECTRPRYNLFRQMWAQANPELWEGEIPGSDQMDEILHAERLTPERQKRTYAEKLGNLPDGSIVAGEGGKSYVVHKGKLLQWSPIGYSEVLTLPNHQLLRVLTPPSVVKTLAAGYVLEPHPSIMKF
jgi:hypothetical protein